MKSTDRTTGGITSEEDEMKSLFGCGKLVFWCTTIAAIILTSGIKLFGQTATAEGAGVLNLDQVIVSATKTEHTLGDVPVAAEVITGEEIEQKQIKTVQDALKYLSGIKINETSSGWGDKGKIQMQGLDEKHALILVDGQRFLGGHGDAVDLQSIPVAMVERIEIVKGPASALYGSDAMGGVVNIITKAAARKPMFSASTSFGSRGTEIHEATGGFRNKAFGALLGYTYRESDGVEKETDHYRENIFQGTLSYDFTPDSRLIVKPYYSEHEMNYEGRTQERVGINSSWAWTPDNLSKLDLRGSLFNYKHFTDDKSSNWDTGTYESEITYSRMFFDRHMLTAGYSFFTEDIDDKGKEYKADQDLHSFYIQDEITFRPFVVVLGTRIDRHDRWGTEANPKASVLYNLTKDLKIRGSVGTAFKGPSLAKLYADGWTMGPYLVHANPDLKPEKSVGYQLGIEYTFLKRYLAKLSLFRNEIEDLINYRTVRRTGWPRYNMYWENIDKAVTEGVEFSLAGELTKTTTVRANYTFLHTMDKELEEELTARPKHKASIELNQKFLDIGLSINVVGQYVGRRYDGDYKRLGGYTQCDIAATQELGKNVQLFAKVENVLDKKRVADEYDIDGTRFLAGLKIVF